jgi:hypothetical protein
MLQVIPGETSNTPQRFTNESVTVHDDLQRESSRSFPASEATGSAGLVQVSSGDIRASCLQEPQSSHSGKQMMAISDWFRTGPTPSRATDKVPPTLSRRRNLLRRFWQTAALFWASRTRAGAWTLSAGLLAIISLLIGATYAMNVWNRGMFDALQNRDAPAVAWLSVAYL